MRIETFLSESPMFCITRSARSFEVQIAQLFKSYELNFLEALILSALFFEASEPVTPSLLAQTLSSTRGNVSHSISSLEARGFVQRKVSPDDARVYHITLRPQGRKAAVHVIGALDKLQKQYEDRVGKETLQKSLRIVRSLNEAG